MKHVIKPAICFSLLLGGSSMASTIHVPADYPTIQGAVDVANDGDEIVVGPGTYTGIGVNVVDTLGKSLTLRSSNGPEVTLVDGQDLRRGINCSGISPTLVTVVGFTVRNGTAPGGSFERDGGGLLAQCDLMMATTASLKPVWQATREVACHSADHPIHQACPSTSKTAPFATILVDMAAPSAPAIPT